VVEFYCHDLELEEVVGVRSEVVFHLFLDAPFYGYVGLHIYSCRGVMLLLYNYLAFEILRMLI